MSSSFSLPFHDIFIGRNNDACGKAEIKWLISNFLTYISGVQHNLLRVSAPAAVHDSPQRSPQPDSLPLINADDAED
ncbi:MAG: hypothetical protein DMG65_18230 [Candidatus Angelobacter sp. Gp1-AA117]|nr:MAG: hypothetical protein DMG65_18230 [Candidatus Angelobacter sp. Gp1-AA117]